MTPQARAMIFKAADSNNDEVVTRKEYIINRAITDEAKEIMADLDSDKNSSISKEEFVNNCPIKDKNLAAFVFAELDINNDGQTITPEYLRVWGKWARSGKNNWLLE
jgi:Ca2+-binding EF-hand superfamily protein